VRKNVAKSTLHERAVQSRYEVKYLISESKAAAITQLIKPYVRIDHYCRLQPTGSYPIASLYLDTEDLQLCQQSMQGHKNRFKLRIRSYSDEPDYPCFFEIKRRLNNVIIKSRSKVMPCSAAPLISGTFRIPQSSNGKQQVIEQFLFYMTGINAKPVVRTRYKRQAFEGILDNTIRITFDRDISCNVTSNHDLGINGQGWCKLRLNGVVLEIKFTGRYPIWVGQMVKYFNLRQQSISKYVHSVKQASLLGMLLA
jgi:hypothetical protein